MNILIRNSGDAPIYDQICTQMKAAILSGELQPGDALPSIRALAKDLRISVITTKRAYDELTAEGFLAVIPGKGCFVAEQNLELLREQQLREIEAHMEEICRLAGGCKLTGADILEMLRTLMEETT
ncbi:MAG: GntR family transcriptional regulator [Ruthenibacterium sp.]